MSQMNYLCRQKEEKPRKVSPFPQKKCRAYTNKFRTKPISATKVRYFFEKTF
jgi:hypothetical protein